MLTTEISSANYQGNGVTTVFALPARVQEAAHLQVFIRDLTTLIDTPLSTSEYTVTGFGSDAGVEVTYPLIGSPLAATQRIFLDRVLPLSQNMDIGRYGEWDEETIEQQFDLVHMILQQLQTNIDRNIYGPDSAAIADEALAAASLFVAKSGSTSTGKQVFRASASGEASIRIQTGVAPAAPAVGDIWSTGTALKVQFGSTLTVVFLEEAHVWTAGAKQSMTHDATTAGLRIVPAASDPSAPVNGDMWYESVGGRLKARVEGVTYQLGIPSLNAESLGLIAGDNPQAGNYTFALTDAGKMVRSTGGSAQNFTVPNNSVIAFPLQTFITIAQYGAGQISFLAAGGVTIRSAGAKTKTLSQYSAATLYKVATNEWLLFGDLTT